MRIKSLVVGLSFVFSLVSGAVAQNNAIPTVPENSPYLAYIHGAVEDGFYNAGTQIFSLTGSASAYYLPRQTGFCNHVTNPSCPAAGLSLAIQVDNNGNLIGGNPVAGQPDFVLTGQITSGGVTYTSPLLIGNVSQFFYDGVNGTPNFAFRIAVTGGSMAGLYLNLPSMNNDLWMTLNLETMVGVTDYSGSFAYSWGGEVKGNVYSTPGQCFGTIGDFVWNDLNANGIQDAGEPGINNVNVNLYDNQGNRLQSVVTKPGPTGSQLGYYQFTGVCPGTYTVKVDETTLPKGSNGNVEYVETTPNAPGSTTANDSNPNPSTVTLSTNDSSDETIDFGYIALQGAIGDYVWYDANHNGLQDAGEPGINGVVVDLYDSTQTNLLATTTTAYGGPNNVNGYYQFTGLSAGNYVIVVDSTTLPTNYTPTTPIVGSNPAIDSNGSPAAVNLPTDSSTNETIDFGYVSPCNGTIGDFVWHDFNQNGIQDAGEPGISGITLNLYDSTHTLIHTAITSGSGNYLFSGLCAGSYEVDVVGTTLPPNFTPTISQAPGSTTANDSNGSPAPVVLTEDSNNNVVSDLTIDFGYVSPCNGAIGDFVWSDLNGNGIQDSGEPGIANVTVSLFDSQQHLLNATTTNQNGYYQFTGLCAATYIVQVTPPAGYFPTTINAPGSTPANDSNPSPSTVVLAITDNNGDITNDETIDFGFVLPLSVTCGSSSTGEVGVAFNSGAMAVTGGILPYTFSVVGTLPAGLSLNTSTGAITGTPTASGTFSVQVTDSSGATSTGCAITINPALSVTCAAVNTGEVGVAFNSGPMTVTGGTAPYTYSVVGTLPAGLSLNTSTGAITGTPTASGTFSVQVTDSSGATSTGCAITINPALSVTCAAVNTGEVGVAFNSGPMTVSGGTAPYTYSVVGTLPAGLILNTTTGAITGTATASGTFSVQVTDANGATSTGCAITINPALSVTCAAVNTGEVGVAFNSGPMTVTGGTVPYTYSVVGTLPAGLSLNTSTGAITGTATAAGTFSVQVKDANGATSTGCAITINPALSVTCAAVNTGEVGVAFNSGPMTVTGGTVPYTYSVVGTLPAGLILNTSTGAITGTATAAGTFSVQVKDANGATSTGCAITINPALSVTCVVINAIQGVAITPVTMSASGGTGTGYTFTATGLPAGLSMSTAGTISGTPTVNGTFSYTVTVTDSNGNKGTLNCSVMVAPSISASCVSILNAAQNEAITPVQMTANGGTGPYTFSATGLPTGLTLSSNGTISGTPTQSGTFNYTVTIKDSAGHIGTVTCTVTIAPPVSTSCVSVTAMVGVPITPVQFPGSGGTGSYTFSATGLPPGLTLSSSGVLSGTPTQSGTFNYTVYITDSAGHTHSGACSHQQTFSCSITVQHSITATCVSIDAVQNKTITPVQMTPNGGTGPYTFSATGLPTGLTLSSNGTISGTPTQSGTFNYTVTIKDSAGHTGTVNCSVMVLPPVTATGGQCGGQKWQAITPVNLSPSGGSGDPYTFGSGNLPPGLNLSSSGTIYGTPTQSGTFNFTIQITDGQGHTGSMNYTATVTGGGGW